MIQFLTQDKDFFPQPLGEKFRYLQQMGFDGFEIDGKLLLNNFELVKESVNTTGFPVLTCCGGYEGWIGDFNEDKRQKAIQQISILLQRIAAVGGKGIVVPAAWGMFSLRLPPMVPPRSAEEDEEILLSALQKLNEDAKKNGATVFLEPLNRYEDHMINTLQKASYYIEEGGFSNVSIIADFYHMNIEEAKIEDSIMDHANSIHHIHLADSHRYQPGSGHIDFENGFRALKAINYDGAMTFECRVIGADAEAEYKKSLHFIKNLYRHVWKKK
jgi:sugar phosphate isomerase/epimerase